MERTIRAPRERVFAAFATADELKKWLGPGECHVTDGELEFHVGGGYRLQMITDNGAASLVGEYREIIDGEKIVYTWEWGDNEAMDNWGQMLVTVNFSDEADGGTLISLKHEGFLAPEIRDGHDAGWDGSFDKLKRCYGSSSH